MNSVFFYIGDKKHTFLLDTGASLSLIKYTAIKHSTHHINQKQTSIKGIGGKITSKGYVELALQHGNTTFEHEFHIFKSLPLNIDGILG